MGSTRRLAIFVVCSAANACGGHGALLEDGGDSTSTPAPDAGDGALLSCQPVALATFYSPFDIISDGSNVYVAEHFHGEILRVPKTGGSPFVLASGLTSPQALALDATHIYWTDLYAGTVSSMPIGGGGVTVLAKGQTSPWAIRVDTDYVYWANDVNVSTAGGVMRVPIAGGAIQVVAKDRTPIGLAIDDTNAYWTNHVDGTLVTAPKTGGASTILATEATDGPTWLVRSGANILWIVDPLENDPHTNGAIMSVPRDGGTVTAIATGQDDPNAIVVDDTYVYWANVGEPATESGTIMRAPIAGGTPTVFCSGLDAPAELAIDGDSIYWVAGGNAASKSPTPTVYRTGK